MAAEDMEVMVGLADVGADLGALGLGYPNWTPRKM